MRHSALFQYTDKPFLRASRTAILAALLSAGVVLAPAVSAQEATPPTTPSATPVATTEAEVTTLMQEDFEEFPRASMTMRLLRITLEPGAGTPMHTHPGPEFDLVESGELTLVTDGEAPVTRATGEEEISSAEPLVIGEGDYVVYPAGTGMSYVNESDAPVVLLSAVILPVGSEFPESITYTDGQPTSQDFDGVSFVVLGDGLLQNSPSGASTISVNSAVLPPGVDLPASDGVAMYSHVEGNFSFIVESGSVQVSRSELEALQPNAVIGEEFILEEGDAAFFPSGVTETSRENETGSLEILSLIMDFEEPLPGEPAVLTFTSGSGATGDATGGPDAVDVEQEPTDGEATGAIVTTNVADVNLRAEPSTTANVIDQLGAGVELEVIGGPEEAEDFVWYQVRVTAPGGNEGWIVGDFLDGLDAIQGDGTEAGADPEEAPADDATAVADAADTTEFAVGEIVATTEDNVRVRAEGNLGGDIVDTFPAGTEFEVTGEAVVADEFTWYPVTQVENPDVTGWVTADFLAPAD